MKRIGDLISPFLKGSGMEEAVKLEIIRRDWRNIFREPLSLHMSPAGLKNGELLINVDSPVWLQQLTLLKKDILKKVDTFGVISIRFRHGRVNAVNRNLKERPPVKATLGRDELIQIETVVSGVKDDSLRESIRQAMAKALARKYPES